MKRHGRWRDLASRCLVLAVFALVLAACDGDGAGSSANTPVIANLVAVLFQQQSCTLEALTGMTLVLSFDYTDADGNVVNGKVEVVTSRAQSSTTQTFAVPSSTVGVTGTTSGTVRVTLCVRFGEQTRVTERVALFDAADNRSNELTIAVDRPVSTL